MVVDIPERESVVRFDAYQLSFLSSNYGRQVPFCWGRLDLSSSAVLHPISWTVSFIFALFLKHRYDFVLICGFWLHFNQKHHIPQQMALFFSGKSLSKSSRMRPWATWRSMVSSKNWQNAFGPCWGGVGSTAISTRRESLGGGFNYFFFHPENWGRWTHFWLIFFKGVESWNNLP